MNYLALAALKHYAQLEGPHREQAAHAYEQLRSRLLEVGRVAGPARTSTHARTGVAAGLRSAGPARCVPVRCA